LADRWLAGPTADRLAPLAPGAEKIWRELSRHGTTGRHHYLHGHHREQIRKGRHASGGLRNLGGEPAGREMCYRQRHGGAANTVLRTSRSRRHTAPKDGARATGDRVISLSSSPQPGADVCPLKPRLETYRGKRACVSPIRTGIKAGCG